jgi:hypothetical protein
MIYHSKADSGFSESAFFYILAASCISKVVSLYLEYTYDPSMAVADGYENTILKI